MEHGKSKGQPAFPPEFVAMLKKHAGTDGKLDKTEFIKLIKEMHGSPPQAPVAPAAPAAPKCHPAAEDANTTPKQHIANLWELILCEADSKYKTFNCPNIIFIKLFD